MIAPMGIWGRPSILLRGIGVAAAIGLSLSACDSLLEVTLPGATPEEALNDPQFAPILVAGGQGNFECAYTNYALLGGVVSGELMGAQTFLGLVPYQRRDVRPIDQGYGEGECNSSTALYTPVAVARFTTDDAFNRLSEWTDAQVPGRTGLLARASLYAGYSYLIFGEGFCSAAFDAGPEVVPDQVFTLATERFSTAIDLATQAGDASVLNTARVGRARARLSLGDLEGAVTDAQAVPPGFERVVTRSSAGPTRANKIYLANGPDLDVSVDPKFWNLSWGGVPDPRVEVVEVGLQGQDGLTPMWRQTKYTSEGSDIRLASYVEAQLIIAEARGGQTAVDIINDLLEAAGLPSFESTDPLEIQEMVREQRRRELFLEGHRMGDLRRYGGTAFQDAAGGAHPFVGDVYGGMECFPLPNVERQNNPNLG